MTTSPLGFTGAQTDDTGLVYLNARYYDPALGSFLSHDPFEGVMDRSGSRNGYNYVEGNPINRTDRTGEIFGFVDAFIAASVIGRLIIGGIAGTAYCQDR